MKNEIKIKVKGCPLIPISKLEIIQGNLKELSKPGYEKLKGRIARLGFDVPIFVWKGKVLDGTQRIRTVQKMIEDGFSLPGNKLPIVEIQAKDLNEAKERLLGYISQFGKVTDEGLYEFVQGLDINFDTLDLPDFNMDKFKIGWFEKEVALTDEDAVPEVPKKAKSKRGQIYQLGRHKVMCGDSTCREDVEKLMGRKRADVVLTDPPYNVQIFSDLENKKYEQFSLKWLNIACDISKQVLFTSGLGRGLGMPNLTMWYRIKRPDWILCWIKKNAVGHSSLGGFNNWEPILFYGKPKKKIPQDIYDIPITVQSDVADEKGNKLHPTPKQVKFYMAVLQDFIMENQTCLDPFLGSGSTLIACEKTNRVCMGLEIDPIYVDVIIKRWEDYVGKKAKLLSKGA